MTSPKDRPMTRLAASMVYGPEGLTALLDDRCPHCKQKPGPFFHQRCQQEYLISGLCQTCQDRVFGHRDEGSEKEELPI